MFTARYGLIPYIKQVAFSLERVKLYHVFVAIYRISCLFCKYHRRCCVVCLDDVMTEVKSVLCIVVSSVR